jgi:hypothetical protein
MTQVPAPNLQDRILSLFRARDKHEERDLEAELRQVFRDETRRTRRRIAAELKELREIMHERHTSIADTTKILRHIRDTQ